MGTAGKVSGGVGQTQWLLLPFGRLLAHRVMGPEARHALGHRSWAVCSPVQLGAALTLPRLPGGNWGDGEALNPEARWLLESSEWSRLGTHPAGVQGKGDGTRAFQDPFQGGSGGLAPVRTHPREGLVHWRGCHPHPGPFPWLKVVKVWKCVRVRRNLLVLPSSTRRVNAFVGDSAFWEHQSPSQSHLLQSWLGEPWSALADGTVRRGHVGHQAPHWAQGRRLCQHHGWTGSPGVLQIPGRQSSSCQAQLDPVPPWPCHHWPMVSPAWPLDPNRSSGAAVPGHHGDRAGGGGQGTMVVMANAPAAASLPWQGWKIRCVPKTQVEFYVSKSLKSRVSGRSCWGLFFLFLFFFKNTFNIHSVAKNCRCCGRPGEGCGHRFPASQHVYR